MIEVEGVVRDFGDVRVLHEIGFEVRPGRMTGFVGANGAGKTTTMRIVMGVLAATSGQVRWQGRAVTAEDRRRFGYMPEERGLYPKMRVAEQLRYFARLHGYSAGDATERASALLERLGLDERRDDMLETLSLGNQQRVQVAAALVHRPVALVLDEPFSGLDPLAVDVMADLLREQVGAGVPVLFSSHQLELVERVCDDLVIVAEGRVVAAGAVDELRHRDARTYELHVPAGTDLDWMRDVRGVPVVDHRHGPDGDLVAVFEVAAGARLPRRRQHPGSDGGRAGAHTRPAGARPGAGPRSGARAAAQDAVAGRNLPRAGGVTAWWRLVSAREVTTRSRDKSFLVSTLVLLVLVVGGIVVGSFVAGRPAAYDVAVTDPADESAARAAVATGALSQLTLATNAERAGTSLAALTRGSTLTEDVTEDGPVSSDAAAAAGFVMALLFFTAAIGFGLAIAQSVVVEKENRIVEILVAAVPTRALLWGKITGNSLLALAQLLVVAAGSVLALAVVGDAGSLPSIGVAGVWFVAFFVVGFVALASVWSVAGALATRQEDLQATSVPGQVLLLVPYLVAVTGNERAIEIASWVPIASSMTMPAQLLAGQASWWQGAVSLALAAVSAALLVRLGARLYERTLLQTSRRTTYRELLAMRG